MNASRCLPVVLLGVIALGCGGSPSAPGRDEVFYLHDGGVIDKNASWEVYFPKYDQPKTAKKPRFVGVGIMDGDVRFARPVDWSIRDANYSPMRRFISYQSPRQFLFTIYERVDHPNDPWPEILRRYEQETEAQGSRIIAARMPIGSANAQGRGYLLKTVLPARPEPLEGYTHEILLRGDSRILLIQIVHPERMESLADEVAHALMTMTLY